MEELWIPATRVDLENVIYLESSYFLGHLGGSDVK